MKSPFKLLDAYDLQDRGNFFGREEEIEALYAMVFKTPLLLVFGQSGTGKTSLIRCGLASRFTGPNWYPFFIHRGMEINKSAHKTLAQVIPLEYTQTSETIKDKVAFIFSHYLRPVYLIFDQFEELLIKGSPDEQQQFASSLRALIDAQLPCKIILVIREEYIGRMYWLEKEIPTLFDFRLRVEPMSSKKIQEVVSASFQKFNIELQNPEQNLPRIYARISDDQSEFQYQLPYLQVYLDMLWQDDFKRTYPSQAEQKNWILRSQSSPPEYPRLFLETTELDAFGNIENVLARFLRQCEQELWEKFSARYPEITQSPIRSVLDAFVTERGTKTPIPVQFEATVLHIGEGHQQKFPVISGQALYFLLNELLGLRILRHRDDTLELAHDSLAALINQERSDDQRRINDIKVRLSSAYHEFIASEKKVWPSQNLLLGIEEYINELNLSPELSQFFQDSKNEIAQKNRAAMRKGILIGIMITGITIIVSSIFIHISQKNKTIATLIASALIQSKTDPTAAITLLKQASTLDASHQAVRSAFFNIYAENEFYLRVLPHQDLLKGVAIGHSNKVLFTWTKRSIYRWSWQGQKLDSIVTDGINDCQYSSQHETLAYCDDKGYIYLIRGSEKSIYKRIQLSERSIPLLAFSADGQYLYYKKLDSDGGFSICKIAIHLPQEPLLLLRFKVDDEPSSFAEHPLTKHFWIGFKNGSVQSYTGDMRLIKTGQPHHDQVLSFAFSPEEGSVVSVDRNGKMYFWKEGVGIQAHEQRINKVIWPSHGSRLFTSSKDYTIKTWSPRGELYATYRGHTGAIIDLAVTSDGQYFATASEDKTVRLWKTASKVKYSYGPHDNGVGAFLLFPEQNKVVTGSNQGEYDFGELMNDQDVDQNELVARQFDFFPRSLSIWEKTGQKKFDLLPHQAGITALARQPDGSKWASADYSGTILLWDGTRKKQAIKRLNGHADKVKQMFFSPGGALLISIGDDNQCIIWNLESGSKKTIVWGEVITGVSPLPNGDWIIGGEDNLKVYDGRFFEPKSTIPLEKSEGLSISTFCLSPNGAYLLVGEHNEQVHLYSISGKHLETLSLWGENKTGVQDIHALAFANDNSSFAAGGEGGLALVYRITYNSVEPIQILQHYPKRAILSLQFSKDGKYVYSGSNDGWLRCWSLWR